MQAIGAILILLALWIPADAHRSGCHATHGCPSDTGAYACGDRGYCGGCADNAYCRGGVTRFNRLKGVVADVLDGDTVSVWTPTAMVRVRLYGVDAPERAQPYGAKARSYATGLAIDQDVVVLVRDTDRYGRIVGEVLLSGGRNLGHEMVEAGLAWWYVQYAKRDTRLMSLEADAKAGRVGLWRDSSAIAPWKWRRGRR